eukprot:c12673_g1_i1.p1 GENE.c12673_g1_i1~~c12673_g1_i1.p1  ORF type:complete len:351 (-),score=102.02 c12673_g1_i1:214-1266(-)
MAKPVILIATGASGTYMYNNSDVLNEVMKDGTRGLIHSLTGPRANPTPSREMRELQGMVTSLSSQLNSISANQRNSHQIILDSSQPSTLFGIATWKLAGLAGTVGYIAFKVHGCELRDLVYVSKRHFNTVAEALKKQYENLDETVRVAKTEMLKRIGLVESKVDEAQKSIELKIDSEVGKLSGQIDEVSTSVSQLDASLVQTSNDIKNIGSDVGLVKSELGRVADGIDQRLERMHIEVEEFKDSAILNQNEMKHQMGKIESKIESMSRASSATLNSLQVSLEHQTRGISLLCEFVRNQMPSSSAAGSSGSSSWMDELTTFTSEFRNDSQKPTLPRKRHSGLAGLKAIAAN